MSTAAGSEKADPITGKHVIIVGSGAWGLSTARALGQADRVTVIDRSEELGPMPDAASSDVSKIIRPDYGDSSIYYDLARQAIERWRTDPIYAPHYHQSGYLAFSSSSENSAAVAYVTGSAAKSTTTNLLRTPAETREATKIGSLAGSFVEQANVATANLEAGWAHATGACMAVADELRYKVDYVSGLAIGLVSEGGRATGVRLRDGKVVCGDLVIVTAGAWAPSILPELANDVVASGQYIAHIELNDDEAAAFRDMPVLLDTATGWYCFPPNPAYSNVFKLAVHSPGYSNMKPSLADPSRSVSTPATQHYDGHSGLPEEALDKLRSRLRTVLPSLADKPFINTRLCWYADSQDSHWLLDWHPSLSNVFIASADSGHGFKFLPVIGDLVVRRIRGELQVERWSWRPRDWRESEDMRGDLASSRRPL